MKSTPKDAFVALCIAFRDRNQQKIRNADVLVEQHPELAHAWDAANALCREAGVYGADREPDARQSGALRDLERALPDAVAEGRAVLRGAKSIMLAAGK